MRKNIFNLLMIILCCVSLVKGQSKDTICIKQSDYKTFLKIEVDYNYLYKADSASQQQLKKFRYTLDTLNKSYNIKVGEFDQCLSEKYKADSKVLEQKKTIIRKNKKLAISYGMIGGWVTYQGVKLYLKLKPNL